MRESGFGGGFFLEGGAQSCLLLPGFSGAGRMHVLGEALNKAGFSVSSPDLSGRLETSGAPRASNWRKWLDEAREAYAWLDRRYASVGVVGFSTGGALAVILAAEYPISAVALISPAIRMRSPFGLRMLALARVGTRGEASASGPDGARLRARDLATAARLARRSLFAVVAPTLIIQPEEDEVVHPSSAKIVFSGISSREKDVLWLTQSRHNSLDGPEFAAIADAIKNHLCRAAAPKILVN